MQEEKPEDYHYVIDDWRKSISKGGLNWIPGEERVREEVWCYGSQNNSYLKRTWQQCQITQWNRDQAQQFQSSVVLCCYIIN